VAASAIVGISDNPPGIALAFLASACFALAFVHPWRTIKPFARLVGFSSIGFVVLAVLHNVFEALAGMAASHVLLHGLLQGIDVVAFLLAILVCPPTIVVGIVGVIAMFIRNRRSPKQESRR
jgi:hypothetical protein